MKKLIAFLLAFAMLAVGFTYVKIQRTLGEPLIKPKIDLPNDVQMGVDLNGFYDENDLVVTEINEDTDNSYFSYPQFDGLKNEEVQTAINELIRSEAARLKQQDIDAGGDIRYLSYNLCGNFANVLSVGLYSANEQLYLNFNLNDGSLLELQDLFRTDADLQGIIHGAFYNTMTVHNLANRYWEKVNSPDEMELYKAVKAYLTADTQRFLFTPAEIYLYYEDYVATIPVADHGEDIVIYTKYLTEESIFVHDDVGYEGLFTCATIPRAYEKRAFGMVDNRFWYDVAMTEPYFDDSLSEDVKAQFLTFESELYASVMGRVEEITRTVEANPHKAYVLLAHPEAYLYRASEQVGNDWIEIPSRAAEVNLNYSLYEMDADLFESKYRRKLVDLYRKGAYTMFYTGLDNVIDGNEVQLTKDNAIALYDYETGERLTMEDVFVEGYDYMDAIRRQQKYDMAGYYGYTMEAAEMALQNARFELEGSSIRTYLPEWGEEQYLVMAFSQFPRTALAIFD